MLVVEAAVRMRVEPQGLLAQVAVALEPRGKLLVLLERPTQAAVVAVVDLGLAPEQTVQQAAPASSFSNTKPPQHQLLPSNPRKSGSRRRVR